MTNDRTLSILKSVGAIITDSHFVYTSGKHGSVYIRKDRLYPHTGLTSDICQMMAEAVRELPVDIVVGPSVGGILLSSYTAFHLSRLTGREVLSVFTEKASVSGAGAFDAPQEFKRGYGALVRGKDVLVVEDLTTTGMSVRKVVDRVREAGGKVVSVMVLLNRNPQQVNDTMFGAPFRSLAVYEADAFDPESCPLCRKGIPVNTEVGHGREFLKAHSG